MRSLGSRDFRSQGLRCGFRTPWCIQNERGCRELNLHLADLTIVRLDLLRMTVILNALEILVSALLPVGFYTCMYHVLVFHVADPCTLVTGACTSLATSATLLWFCWKAVG